MTDRSRRIQTLCAAGGVLAPGIALLALFGTGMMPPQAANGSAEQIAAFYRDGTDLKIAGLFVAFMAIGLLGPLLAAITLQMLRIEGRHPILTFLQVISGAVTWVFLSIPLLILLVALFRADRSPETTQTLHDLGWILFLIPIAPFIVQNVAIATAVLTDDSANPVYPRWVGWTNVWVPLSFVPDALLGFFKTGAFSYQGVAGFWIPAVTYGIWLTVMGLATMRAIREQAAEENATAVAEREPVTA